MRLFLLFSILLTATNSFAETKVLSYFIQNGNKWEWTFWNPADQENVIYTTLNDLPKNIIFCFDKKSVLYEQKDGIYENKWPEGRKEKLFTDTIPKTDNDGFWWIDKTTNRIRTTYLMEVNDSNRQEFQMLNSSNLLPDWGVEYICYVNELQEDGTWKNVAKKATKWEAGETPGYNVISDLYENAEGVNYSAACEWNMEKYDYFKKLTDKAKAKLRSEFHDSFDDNSSQIQYFPSKDLRNGIAIHTETGDTWHYMLPILFCKENCLSVRLVDDIELTSVTNQIGISFYNNFLLITEEYVCNCPYVYDRNTMKLIFHSRDAKNAAWIYFPKN